MPKAITRAQKGATPVTVAVTTVAKPRTVSTLIALQILPRGEKFERNLREAAIKAGFVRLPRDLGIGQMSKDTEAVISTIQVYGRQEVAGEVTHIECRIDPEHCATQWRAGENFLATSKRYAEVMDGVLCDANGAAIDELAMAALAGQIDAIIDLRMEKQRPGPVKLGDGSTRLNGPLSYQHIVHRRSPGSRKLLGVEQHSFVAEPMSYQHGRVQGLRMLRELMDFYRAHKVSRPGFNQIIASALGVPCPRGSYYEDMRDNVVVGFLDGLEELVMHASRNTDPKWIDCLVALAEGGAA